MTIRMTVGALRRLIREAMGPDEEELDDGTRYEPVREEAMRYLDALQKYMYRVGPGNPPLDPEEEEKMSIEVFRLFNVLKKKVADLELTDDTAGADPVIGYFEPLLPEWQRQHGGGSWN